MRFKLDKQYLKYYAYAVLGVISVILFYKVLDNLGLIITTTGQVIQDIFGMLLPIILGGVLAYFLFRPMRWFERKIFKYIKGTQAHPKKVRFTAIVIVYLIALFFMVVFLYILIPSIVESVINLAGHIPQYTWEINRFLDQLSQSGTALKDLAGIIRVELANFTDLTLKGFFDSFVGDPGSVSGSMAQMGNMAVLFAKGTTSFLISSVAVFFSGFYLMLDKENIQGQCQRLFRALMSDSVYGGFTWVVHTIDDVFYRYFAGKIMTSALIGLICYVGLLILGVEYAPLIALVVGVTNVIPYFGPIIGAIPGILLTLLYSPVKALWVAIWILIVQQFDGNILGPTVLGRIVELNPFWVLLSVMVGGSLMGPFGMFIAIPFFAVIKIFLVEGLNRWEAHREKMTAKAEREAVTIIEKKEENEEI